jgi:Domain of unknown function (DUF5666)
MKTIRTRLPGSRWLGSYQGLIIGLVLITGNSSLPAQVSSPENTIAIRGKITDAKSQELIDATNSGAVSVKLPDTTVIRSETMIKFSDIAAGMYLGTTAEKQSDGTFFASEVHVFSEDQRGTGEGHRPSSSVPNSTMTNANVEKVEDVAVQAVRERLMYLKYKGGEVKVFVPPDIPIVKRVPGDRAMLKPGAEVSIQSTRAADGSLTASQITVRAAGDK